MALIHILDNGTERDVDESLLVRTDGVVDDDNERTVWVEYRFPDSDVIVHRSVHVTIKKWPGEMAGIAATFG